MRLDFDFKKIHHPREGSKLYSVAMDSQKILTTKVMQINLSMMVIELQSWDC
jgi:hypothetical protein